MTPNLLSTSEEEVTRNQEKKKKERKKRCFCLVLFPADLTVCFLCPSATCNSLAFSPAPHVSDMLANPSHFSPFTPSPVCVFAGQRTMEGERKRETPKRRRGHEGRGCFLSFHMCRPGTTFLITETLRSLSFSCLCKRAGYCKK